MFDPYHKWLSIPLKDQPPNHYRLLGIELFESDSDVIDAAANKQMAFVQGCATGPHLALSQKLLNEIAAARLCLLNPKRKAAYDAQLRARSQAAPAIADVVLVAEPTTTRTNAPAPDSSEASTAAKVAGGCNRHRHSSAPSHRRPQNSPKSWPFSASTITRLDRGEL